MNKIYANYIKRIIDIIIAICCLPVLGIIWIVIAVLIKYEDSGPIFYNSYRIGKNGISFKMYKFRTMKVNAPDIRLSDGSTYNSKYDPRVTKIGHYLRELSLDEIPQLFNVLIGNMSFIGPRPDMKSDNKYQNVDDYYLSILPGITGYSQAYFRNESNWSNKLMNDKYYEANISFILDFKIVLKTIKSVIQRKNIYKK